MKKIYVVIILVITGLASSCIGEISYEDISFKTNYPVFEYEPMVVIALGGTYTPEVTATEDGESLDVAASGIESVDTNTVGVYEASFSAANSDGFSSSVTQTIVVHNPEIVGSDVSGAIKDVGRPSRTGVITLIPGTTSIFFCTDMGFGGTFPVYFQMDGDVISDIPQNYFFGATKCHLTYDPNEPRTFTNLIEPYGFDYAFIYQ